ncbi:MAG: LysR substrate-binding domain-containing protein [Neisseria sp.]|nr:LysR substrate-binding domain-containing protein [Neisseria sp.]
MKLQQLRYALEVYRHNLNVSEAADAVFTSQPGVSKQIRLLEEELGVEIFIRNGKRIVSVTEPGKAILQTTEKILRDIQNIKNISREFNVQDCGTLTIAASADQIRYVLPSVVTLFARQYPKVSLNIRQGSPESIEQMVADGSADLAVSAQAVRRESDLRSIPCTRWPYGVIVPDGHPLLSVARPTLSDLAAYPLIACEFTFEETGSIARAFRSAGMSNPHIALSAADNDILKNHIRYGLGIGLLPQPAFSPQQDGGLQMIDVSQLFEPAYTRILLRADTYLRSYIYDFIGLFSPDLNKERIQKLLFSPIEEDFSI